MIYAGNAVTMPYTPTQAGEQTVSVEVMAKNGSVTFGRDTSIVYPTEDATRTSLLEWTLSCLSRDRANDGLVPRPGAATRA